MNNRMLRFLRRIQSPRTSVVVIGVVVLALIVACAPGPVLSVIGVGLVLVVLIGAIGTAIIGVAITAVVRPLAPIAETSLLGARLVAFCKFALAAGALFSTAVVGWIVTASYSVAATDVTRFSATTGQLGELLLFVVVLAAIIFWMWLSVDLLRIGRRRRASSIDLLVHRFGGQLRGARKLLRCLATRLVDRWWWIVAAFYLVPVLVLGTAMSVTSELAYLVR